VDNFNLNRDSETRVALFQVAEFFERRSPKSESRDASRTQAAKNRIADKKTATISDRR
jgi:hypothetical protein